MSSSRHVEMKCQWTRDARKRLCRCPKQAALKNQTLVLEVHFIGGKDRIHLVRGFIPLSTAIGAHSVRFFSEMSANDSFESVIVKTREATEPILLVKKEKLLPISRMLLNFVNI